MELRSVVVLLAISLCYVEGKVTETPAVTLPAPEMKKTPGPDSGDISDFKRIVFLRLGVSLIIGVVIAFIQCCCMYIIQRQCASQEPAELEEVVVHKPVVPEAVMELGNIPDMGIMDSIQMEEEKIIIEETPLINEVDENIKKEEEVTKKKSDLKQN